MWWRCRILRVKIVLTASTHDKPKSKAQRAREGRTSFRGHRLTQTGHQPSRHSKTERTPSNRGQSKQSKRNNKYRTRQERKQRGRFVEPDRSESNTGNLAREMGQLRTPPATAKIHQIRGIAHPFPNSPRVSPSGKPQTVFTRRARSSVEWAPTAGWRGGCTYGP